MFTCYKFVYLKICVPQYEMESQYPVSGSYISKPYSSQNPVSQTDVSANGNLVPGVISLNLEYPGQGGTCGCLRSWHNLELLYPCKIYTHPFLMWRGGGCGTGWSLSRGRTEKEDLWQNSVLLWLIWAVKSCPQPWKSYSTKPNPSGSRIGYSPMKTIRERSVGIWTCSQRAAPAYSFW